ncbi:Zinc carboxypeptidase A 1 [Taenia solium]|eukprot:TsM_000322600 transcript=TsM_000322600 gene=TsM_000322600
MLKWIKVIAVFLVLHFVFCDGSTFRRHRIYRLRVPKDVAKSFMEALEAGEDSTQYDVLQSRGDYLDVMVEPSALKEFRKLIQVHKVPAQIIDNDVERSIKRSKRANMRAMSRIRSRRSNGHVMSHDAYFPFNVMEDNLHEIVRRVKIATLEELGKTVEERSIWLLKISTNKTLPIIWIDAGIHAREWIAPASALYIIDMLLSLEGSKMLQKYQFYVAPEINPDGYAFSFTRSRYWRKNRNKTAHSACYGVDLNRNFPFKWGFSGSSSNPCGEIFRGLSAADQAETQSVVKKLISIANQTKLFITLHSYGQLILTPYGFQRGLHPANYDEMVGTIYLTFDLSNERIICDFVSSTQHDLESSKRQFTIYPKNPILIKSIRNLQLRLTLKIIYRIWKQYGVVYSTGSAADLLYAAAGGSDDFACGSLKIPYTYTFELPDLGSYNFLLPPAYITLVGKEMWTALETFVDYMK